MLEGAFTPAANIVRVKELSQTDFDNFAVNAGRALDPEFKTQLETKAGKILSSLNAEDLMNRLADPSAPSADKTETGATLDPAPDLI